MRIFSIRTIATLALCGALALPTLAAAEVTVTNSSSVKSSTSASSNTGGNTVGEGGSVKTGDAKASSHSTTNIEGGEGEVQIEVETSVNGEVKRETVLQEVSGGSVEVGVSATAGSAGSESRVEVNGEVLLNEQSTSSATSTATTAEEVGGRSLVASIFEAILDLFWFW